MPLKRFVCPDGAEIPLEDCLKHCRMATRCVSKPTLLTIVAGRREWSGRPSTTQLINGTMMSYLRIKQDYAVSPRGMAYSLLGSQHHALLSTPYIYDAEHSFDAPEYDITGTADLLEPDDDMPGYHIITDYKTYGSYRVAKLLGLKYNTVATSEVYKRSGPWGKAGSPVRKRIYYQDPEAIDDLSERLQLNHYRILAERSEYKISKMQLQVTVRDGGIKQAQDRGIDQLIYYPVPIARMPDDQIIAYFERKRLDLILHINNDVMPAPCNDEEAWGGRRCQEYCEVARFCPRGVRELAAKAP